jgi:hypothetical protein
MAIFRDGCPGLAFFVTEELGADVPHDAQGNRGLAIALRARASALVGHCPMHSPIIA